MYLPKFRRLSVPCLWFMGMCLMGCSSEGIGTEPKPIESASDAVTLRFALGANAFTKAEGNSDNAVGKLTISFFHSNGSSPLFLQNVEAEISEDNTFKTTLNIIPGKEPDMLIAFANVGIEDLPDNFNDLLISKASSVKSEDNLIMTTPRYFNGAQEDIYYQTFDYTVNETINLEVERIGAKVSVSSENPTLNEIETKNADGGLIKLKLSLDSWGLTATDGKTFLIRQIDSYSDMNDLFSGWTNWINSSKKELNWSKSVNYKFDENNSLQLLTASEATLNFGESYFSHETTRDLTIEETLNSKPSIVLVGQYTRSDREEAETFFSYHSFIYTEEELTNIFLSKAAKSLNRTVDDIKGHLELAIDKNSPTVSLQATENINLNGYKDKDGNDITDINKLNEIILEVCGSAEMYNEGKCFFVVPIEHAMNGSKKIYGLVRNHYYQLSIKEISGLGRGIADQDQELGELPPAEDSQDESTIKFTLSVRDWNDHNQDVTISPVNK